MRVPVIPFRGELPWPRTAQMSSSPLRRGPRSGRLAARSPSLPAMSTAPHCMNLRTGTKMGSATMIDTMIVDALWDAFNGYHMGNTAENVAKQFQITREQQDQFAAASQQKAEAAQKAGKFKDEIVP